MATSLDQHNSEAEQAIIGSILIDPLASQIIQEAGLAATDFYNVTHQHIYHAVLAIVKRGITADIITLSDELERQGTSSDAIDLITFVNAVPTSANIDHYIAIVKRDSQARRWASEMQSLAGAMATAGQTGDATALAEIRKRLDAIEQHSTTQKPAPRPFKTIDDVFNLPQLEWVIEGVLPAKATAALVADGGIGKSFLALDWALTIAAGLDWMGRKTQEGHVYYMVGEGVGDLQYRVKAWSDHHQVPLSAIAPYVHLDFEATPLSHPDKSGELIERLAIIGDGLRFVVIDTLSCVMVGADGNDNKDVAMVVDTAKRIKAATGATVLILHHTGKNGEIRGATSLRDDCDTVMMLTEKDHIITMEASKQKYAEKFAPITLKREKRYLDETATISSCVIVGANTKAQPQKEKMTQTAYKLLEALGMKFGAVGASYSEWLEISKVAAGSIARGITELKANGYVLQENQKNYCLTGKGRDYLHQSEDDDIGA